MASQLDVTADGRLAFMREVEQLSQRMFHLWMDKEAKKAFGGPGLPTFWNHPAIKSITALLEQEEPEGVGEAYAIELAAWLEAMCRDDVDFYERTIAAGMMILFQHAPRAIIDALSRDCQETGDHWWGKQARRWGKESA